jgi:hypothetical protein
VPPAAAAPASAPVLLLAASRCARASGPTPGQATLEPVVVSAPRLLAQTLIDRTVYSVTAGLQRAASTAAAILNEVLSVEVDLDGNVGLRGDCNVTILLDGKPSAQFFGAAAGDGLLRFPASDSEKIAAITAPPAQYKSDGSGGITNIVTRPTGGRSVTAAFGPRSADVRRSVAGRVAIAV